ncbi:gluconokinase [Cellvibrio zantedeschiae]|nr:gluconokinase, GntK/IdnK-type [Cellvibrio zantedeschiae]
MIPQNTVSNPKATTNLIIVMGVSGSGKSTLAKALGDIYGYEYLDGDDFHSAESRALMAQAIPLTDEHRTPWVAAIKHRLQSNDSQHIHTILAFSGLKKKHRDELRSAGLRTIVLYLNGSKETIGDRITSRTGHFMSPALLDSQFAGMENPLDEQDVHLIDVWPPVDQVIAHARNIIDQHLVTQTHTSSQA